ENNYSLYLDANLFSRFGKAVEIGGIYQIKLTVTAEVASKEDLLAIGTEARMHMKLLHLKRPTMREHNARSFKTSIPEAPQQQLWFLAAAIPHNQIEGIALKMRRV